jgi:dTDP-4-amino-4,6-dideoxygalactose transaminase
MAIARRYGLAVIEDAACAIGTRYNGTPIGGIGDFGCFSFHPRKVITTGEGGMVVTNDAEYSRRVQSLRNHGATGLPPASKMEPHGPWTMASFDRLGFNLRLSDIQAAVGIAQMTKLRSILEERWNAANHYWALLADVDEISTPSVPDLEGHTYQSFVIRLLKGGRNRRNRIMEELQKRGIQTRPGTHAIHRLGYYAAKYGFSAHDYPNATQCEDTTITLPIFPGMPEVDRERVVATLLKGLSSG